MYYEWINLLNYYNLEGPTLMARTKALPLTSWYLLSLPGSGYSWRGMCFANNLKLGAGFSHASTFCNFAEKSDFRKNFKVQTLWCFC